MICYNDTSDNGLLMTLEIMDCYNGIEDAWFKQYFISLYTYRYLTICLIKGPGSDSKLKVYTSHFLVDD